MAELKYFFSYSRQDSDFVLKLAKELHQAGANLWLDQLDIRGGEPFDEAIEKALRSCQGVIAVLSPASVASDHVRNEISFALEKRKPIIPVIIQECEVPIHVGRRQRIDFSASYETGFSKLLKALQIEQPAPSPEPGIPDTHISTDQANLHGDLLGEVSRPTPKAEEFPHSKAQTPLAIEPPPTTMHPESERILSDGKKGIPSVRTGIGGQTWRQRLVGALIGYVIGVLFFTLMVVIKNLYPRDVVLDLGMIWIIPGALCGTDKRAIKTAFIGCLVAGVSGVILVGAGVIQQGLEADLVELLSVPIGAIGGAIIAILLKKLS